MKSKTLFRRWSHSFATRLFLCIFSTSFLLLLVGEIVLFAFSIRASTNMDQALTISNLKITGENLELLLKRVDTDVQLAFSQKGVLSATQENLRADATARETVHHALIVAVASDDTICQMSLCSDADGVLSTQANRTSPYTDLQSCMAYFESLGTYVTKGAQTWYFLQPHPLQPDEYAFANVRTIQPLGANKKEMILSVSISEPELSDAYGFLGKNSYIMTSDGTIVSAVDHSIIGQTADADVLSAIPDFHYTAVFLFRRQSQSFYSVYLPTIDCHLIVITSATVLNSTKFMMAVFAITVIVFGSFFSLIWSNYLSGTMTRPLRKLKDRMEESRGGKLNVRCEPEREDEIGYLCESFNQMMDNLDAYIEQLSQQQNLAKETEIRLLQSQINPHLLYNTLDSALFLMSHNTTEQSIQILEQLSQYFKLSLQRGNQIITIEAALQHAEAYLKLQNLCRMKNFVLSVTGDSSLLQADILHMLLQPIVENSVLHGFEGNFADGTIEINLQKQGDHILISITDDGMGMSEQELETLRRQLAAPTPGAHSFGMWNIAKRIQMFYGPEYSMQVDSEFGEFTTVTLEIPCRFGQSKEDIHV